MALNAENLNEGGDINMPEEKLEKNSGIIQKDNTTVKCNICGNLFTFQMTMQEMCKPIHPDWSKKYDKAGCERVCPKCKNNLTLYVQRG